MCKGPVATGSMEGGDGTKERTRGPELRAQCGERSPAGRLGAAPAGPGGHVREIGGQVPAGSGLTAEASDSPGSGFLGHDASPPYAQSSPGPLGYSDGTWGQGTQQERKARAACCAPSPQVPKRSV